MTTSWPRPPPTCDSQRSSSAGSRSPGWVSSTTSPSPKPQQCGSWPTPTPTGDGYFRRPCGSGETTSHQPCTQSPSRPSVPLYPSCCWSRSTSDRSSKSFTSSPSPARYCRTLVGSIGLVLAVPVTTALGVAVVKASGKQTRQRRRSSEDFLDDNARTPG